MLASSQIKTVKPPDKKPGFSNRLSFLPQRSVKFQFVWEKLCYNIVLARLLQKYVGLHDSYAKYQKILSVFAQEVPYGGIIKGHNLSVSAT